MKINQWARIQTFNIIRSLSLWILAILFPIFILGLILSQISNVDSSLAANRKNLIVSMQTGDMITLEKTLIIYTQDPSLLGYDLYDRDHHLVKQARNPGRHIFSFSKHFTLIGSDGSSWGFINLHWTPNLNEFLYFALLVILIVSIVAFVIFKAWKKFSNTLVETIEQMPNSLESQSPPPLLAEIEELNFLFQKMKFSQQQELENQKILSQREKEIALFDLSQKVAHDIRSPLSAISLATATADIDEERKILIKNSIQRMNEICEQLLKLRKRNIAFKQASLKMAIDQIIAEKRTNLPADLCAQIEVSENDSDLSIPNYEFKDVLSNLIQNSIESFNKDSNKISISTISNNGTTSITIKDNGKGIPENILKKLGSSPLTYGKGSSGNGLGFFNAKQWAQKYGGDIKINSSLHVGTEVELSFSAIEQA